VSLIIPTCNVTVSEIQKPFISLMANYDCGEIDQKYRAKKPHKGLIVAK
jgi:hypothetical protein